MAPEISNFAITGYFDPASPPALGGSISGFLYWYEGLANWVQLTETPPTVPVGTAFHPAVQWLNQGAEAVCGHIELTITKPDGTKVTPNDVLNQDSWAAPGNGWAVQFEPVILDQSGDYQAEAVLSSIGQTLDRRSVSLAHVLNPTVMLGTGEYNTIEILTCDGKNFESVSPDGKIARLATPRVMSGLNVPLNLTYRDIKIRRYDPGGYVKIQFWFQYAWTDHPYSQWMDTPQFKSEAELPPKGTPFGLTYSTNFYRYYWGKWVPGIYEMQISWGVLSYDQSVAWGGVVLTIQNAVQCTTTGHDPGYS